MSFAKPWVPLAPGIDYQDIPYTYPSPWSHIHVFKIDLQQNQLDLITAHEMHQLHGSIQQFADYGHALIALNGGFFDQAYQPLGLRIGHAHRYNALKSISWWGVFSIEGRRAHISSYKDFKLTPNTDFAIQSGPRLLINNTIPKLKPGRAERSALGINAQGHIIILVTENSPLTTAELAHLMQSSPLRCESALNLDGGSSTQLFAELNHFKLNTHRFNPVSDAILVQARKNTSH
jgi:uncharacterized protein YigE (DUF2233 family)